MKVYRFIYIDKYTDKEGIIDLGVDNLEDSLRLFNYICGHERVIKNIQLLSEEVIS